MKIHLTTTKKIILIMRIKTHDEYTKSYETSTNDAKKKWKTRKIN